MTRRSIALLYELADRDSCRLSSFGNARRPLHRSQVHLAELIQFVALFLILLSKTHNLSNDLYIEAVPLGF
jgi:hypothetical protein